MTCPQTEQLTDFALGKLPEEQSDVLAQHIETCPECSTTIETLDRAADTLVSCLVGQPAPAIAENDSEYDRAAQRVKQIGREPSQPAAVRSETSEAQLSDLGQLREYKLLAKLGQGGMGAVYKALHTRLERVVALKVLPAERMQDAAAVARFSREMKAVGKLDHPHIVRATDAGEVDGTHFLVMEYVAGCDLAEMVKRNGPLPVADACELVRQASLGLAYAHDHGLVHRDIKPSNLMLAVQESGARRQEPGDRGQESVQSPHSAFRAPHSALVKILDLGLALLADEPTTGRELTSSGQMMGTVDYMAPEQAHSSHSVDARADLYSLGATLYKLLTGEAPFSGPKYQSTVQKLIAITTEQPIPVTTHRPEIPAPLSQLIDRLLAKYPTDRPATAAQVAALLSPFCTTANLSLLPLPPGEASSSLPLPLGEGRGEGLQASVSAVRPLTSPSSGTLSVSPHPLSTSAPHASVSPSPPLPISRSSSSRRPILLTLALASLAALVLCGVWIIIKDKDGKQIAKVKAEGPVTVEVQEEVPPANPSDATSPPAEPKPGSASTTAPTPPATTSALEFPKIPIGPPIPRPKPVEYALEYDPITVKPGEPLYPAAYVSQPAALPGVLSWTIELAQPRGYVRVAVSPDDKQVATGAEDGVIRLWDLPTGAMRAAVVPQSLAPIHRIEWSPAGRFVAIGSEGKSVAIVDVVNARSLQIGSLNSLANLRWSPDGRFLAWPTENQIEIWDAVHQRLAASLKGHRSKPLVLAWSPTGEQIASAAEDRAVLVWNVASLQPLQSIALPGTSYPTSIDWSPDGRTLVTKQYHGEMSLWNPVSGALLSTVSQLMGSRLGGNRIRWSPDGRLLLSDKGRVFDVKTWQVHQFTSSISNVSGNDCSWSMNGDTAFIGHQRGHSYYGNRLHNLKTVLTGYHPLFANLGWADERKTLVFLLERSGIPPLVSLWKTSDSSFPQVFALPDRTFAVINPKSGQVAAIGTKVQVWDWSVSKFVTQVTLPSPALKADWSPDGTQLAILHADKSLRIWTIADGSSVTLAENAGRDERDLTSLVRWSPDGLNVAVVQGNSYEGSVSAWNVESRSLMMSKQRKSNVPTDVVWSADGKTVGFTSTTNFSRVSPDGSNLASGSDDGLVRVTDVATKRTVATVTLLPRTDKPIIISGDGHYLCEADVTGQLFYVVQTADSQQTYTPAEFAAKFGWKNDPSQVKLTAE